MIEANRASSSAKLVSMSTLVWGRAARMSRVASIPEPSWRRTSMTMTSGRARAATATASRAEPASAQTTTCVVSASSSLMPSRTTWWSSTSITRNGGALMTASCQGSLDGLKGRVGRGVGQDHRLARADDPAGHQPLVLLGQVQVAVHPGRTPARWVGVLRGLAAAIRWSAPRRRRRPGGRTARLGTRGADAGEHPPVQAVPAGVAPGQHEQQTDNGERRVDAGRAGEHEAEVEDDAEERHDAGEQAQGQADPDGRLADRD